MDLTKLIDEEDIMLDSHKLAEFHNSNELKNKIDEVRDRFIDKNTVDDESYWITNFSKIQLIYKFAEEIKNTLDV